MSRRRNGRDVNGILLLDKPTGMTSNAALQQIKKYYFANKAGHTGSLDPLASGMLPIAFGEATKFSQFLLDSDKSYLVTAQLGIKTASGDTESEVVKEEKVPELTMIQIERVLDNFRGVITQIPSMYSALKFQGKPLYTLARQGIEITRAPRAVTIFELSLLNYDQGTVSVSVKCSKGTYIRTLIDDIGDAIGCGAHVKSLRRIGVAGYMEEQMITVDTIKSKSEIEDKKALDEFLLPIDSSLSTWEEVRLSDLTAFYVRQGQPVIVPRAPSEGWVKLVLSDGAFFGIGEVLDDGRVAPRRLVRQF